MESQRFILNEQTLSVVERIGEHMPGGFFISETGENETLLYANRALCLIFGCDSLEEFKAFSGCRFRGMIYPEDYEEACRSINRQKEESPYDTVHVSYRIRRRDGELRWVETFGRCEESDQGPSLFYVFVSDITDQRQLVETVRAQRSAVIEALTRPYDSVWLIEDVETQRFRLYRIDKTIAHLLPAQEAGKFPRFTDALRFYAQLVLPEDRQRFLEATTPESIIRNTRDKLIYSVPFRRVFPQGVRYYQLEFAKLELDADSTNIVAGFKDVDEEVRRNQQLHRALQKAIDLSETDRMTGLLNRVTGEARIRDCIDHGRIGMFVLFDIDHFKLFNDRFGHTVGDQVILAVADCLKSAFRGEDIVMRLGGDEFAAFAPGVRSRTVGHRILERFYRSLENAVVRDGVEPIHVSAGVTFSANDRAVRFQDLYESADRAMYESKRSSGGGGITFHDAP